MSEKVKPQTSRSLRGAGDIPSKFKKIINCEVEDLIKINRRYTTEPDFSLEASFELQSGKIWVRGKEIRRFPQSYDAGNF